MATGEKAPGAFKTIGELSQELGVAQHILRYWETKFPQLRPLQRAGNRRYYRPADVDLARRINRCSTRKVIPCAASSSCCDRAPKRALRGARPRRRRCRRPRPRRRASNRA
jgi:DNA-binding transcriptional MerR regulator